METGNDRKRIKKRKIDITSNDISKYSPDSETEGLPADLSEFLELPLELTDAVPREHSEMLRRLDSNAAEAAAVEPVGALWLNPWRPWSA